MQTRTLGQIFLQLSQNLMNASNGIAFYIQRQNGIMNTEPKKEPAVSFFRRKRKPAGLPGCLGQFAIGALAHRFPGRLGCRLPQARKSSSMMGSRSFHGLFWFCQGGQDGFQGFSLLAQYRHLNDDFCHQISTVIQEIIFPHSGVAGGFRWPAGNLRPPD